MPKHSTYEEWLKRTDGNGHLFRDWCAFKEKEVFYCKICPASISTSGKGFQGLSQHVSSMKHISNAKTRLNPLQLTLAGAPERAHQDQDRGGAGANDYAANTRRLPRPENAPNLSNTAEVEENNLVMKLVSRKNAAVVAELQWAMKCVQSAYSNNSCENIVFLFRSMFGEEHVPKDMSIGRTKVSNLITDALGPYFHKNMLDDAHVALSYSLCFDETVNNKHVKELQCGIRFWSEKSKEVSYNHLETVFIGSATGVILTDHLMAVVGRASMCLNRFLMLSCDGPNVNKTVIRLMNEKVKEVRGKGFMDAGTCNLHILHNSFLAGLEIFGEDIGQLVIAIYEYFTGFPSRVEEYKKSQLHANVPDHVFLKHVTSRWLTLSAAAERLQEQWPAVIHFFLTVIPKSNADSFKKIRETQRYLIIKGLMKDPVCQAKIAFVVQSAKLFERYSKVFQKSEPMVHMLYDELCSLFVLLLGRFCKSDLVSTSRACLKEEFITKKENLLPLKQVDCGDSTEVFLSKCKEVDVLKFQLDAQKHYQAVSKHLLRKSVLSKWPDGKHLRCLQPGAIKDSGSVRSIGLVHKMLRLNLNVDEDLLKDEWRILQRENLLTFDASTRIDHFWREIFDINGPDGLPKFPNIAKVVKAALPIAHRSSDVERGFSESGHQLRPEQSRMEERLLNSKLWIKDGLKTYEGRPEFVPMTKELVAAGHRAYRNYADHLEELRSKEEEKARQVAEQEEQRRLREASEIQQREDRAAIEELENKLKDSQEAEKDQRKAADQLVEDATKRLETALKAKDLAGAKVAKGCLLEPKP